MTYAYTIRSSRSDAWYTVALKNITVHGHEWTCTCPDYFFRHAPYGRCKHIEEAGMKLRCGVKPIPVDGPA